MTDDLSLLREAMPHRQVKVEHDESSAYVDEGIAPLILELWRAGFRTLNSCEDNDPLLAHAEGPGYARRQGGGGLVVKGVPLMVSVPLMVGATEQLVVLAFPGSVWIEFENVATLEAFVNALRFALKGDLPPEHSIDYRAGCEWVYAIELDEDGTRFTASVRFPRSDLDEVLARIRKHNLRRGLNDD